MKLITMAFMMVMCAGLTSCVLDDGTVEEPELSEVQQNACIEPAFTNCVLTAIRDGNDFLVRKCVETLCDDISSEP